MLIDGIYYQSFQSFPIYQIDPFLFFTYIVIFSGFFMVVLWGMVWVFRKLIKF